LTNYKTDYTNHLPSFVDLDLDSNRHILWYIHKDTVPLETLLDRSLWKRQQNIFLVDSENLTCSYDTVKENNKIHLWTPTVSRADNCHTYLFWFDWMQEIEHHLRYNENIKPNLTKQYLFDALLGTLRPHKDIVNNFIVNSSNSNKFLLSYSGNHLRHGCKWIKGCAVENPGDLTIHYNNTQEANLACVIPYLIYNQCWYSLVTETSGTLPNYYTEKTGKPLLAKRVFVMFAAKHHLKHLKGFGFKTFDGIIDESYDNIEDLETRYQQAWKQVEFLMSQDPLEVYKKTEPILEHNRNHFMSTDWQKEMHEKIQNISQSSK